MQKLTGSASISALTSKANLEIPIVKNHVSLLLNGRTTYSDWILKQLPDDSEGVPVGESIQKEFVALRDEFNLPYKFPFEK